MNLPESAIPLLQLIFGCSLVVAAGVYALLEYQRRKYPPGPSPLFALATLLFWIDDLLEIRVKCRNQYGQLYSWFGTLRPAVVLASYDSITAAFIDNADHCSSRPPGVGNVLTGFTDKGIVASDDWKEQRRFALTVLREHGMGKIGMETKILDEAKEFMNAVEQLGRRPVDVESCIHKATANVISSFVLGKRFTYSDPVFDLLLVKLLGNLKGVFKIRILDALPLLKRLPGDIFGYCQFERDMKTNRDFFLAAIRQHAQTLDCQHPRDFIDAYLIEMKEKAVVSPHSSFDEMGCMAVAMELFIAGTETTATSLLWAWLFMVLHPDVQKKVQDEIDLQLGSRTPSMNDRAACPYVEAVLGEVMRVSNVAFGSLPHFTDTDVLIGEHRVPKGTVLIASLYNVHVDEKTFAGPCTFNPDRFISAAGTFEKPKRFIPFGIGRRACPGESLAKAEMFLFFTSVLQRFDLRAPAGVQSLSSRGRIRFTRKPQPYSILFLSRDRASAASTPTA